MSAMISSGLSAFAIGYLNNPKKKSKEVDPKIEKGIKSLNKALQKTVADAVVDLYQLLRFYPVFLKILDSSIDDAEKRLQKDNKESPKQLREDAEAIIAIARHTLATQKELAADNSRAHCVDLKCGDHHNSSGHDDHGHDHSHDHGHAAA
eukprot:TRINITY_DN45650_c0_g1_i1.p1 TRINITY_DN45650_c0_g1~~TRINITY_DN45650_c0_g1_i1.p1  ORF type:complete len:150 (-),score=34.40 TRINITY_DN45650_c0_g1_i1:20-469(-)